MFKARLGPPDERIREESTILLAQRGRAGLWICLLSVFLFGLSNLIFRTEPLGLLLGIKGFQVGLIAAFSLLLRLPSVTRNPVSLLLFAICSFSFTTAAAGVVYGDFLTTGLLLALLALVTALTFPWGVAPQVATAAITGSALVWNVVAVGGGMADVGYPAIAVVVALAASVFVAAELHRSRVTIATQVLELRGYRDVVESATDGIVALDGELRVTGANRGAGVIFGVSGEDLVGSAFPDLVGGKEKARILEEWRQAKAEDLRGRIDAFEVRREGREVVAEAAWIEATIQRADPDNAREGFHVILRDVSERKAMEQMRSDLVAMLSHDIRNPLGVILGFADLLGDEPPDARELQDGLDRISVNARQALNLAENFVDATTIESGAFEVVRRPGSLNQTVLAALRDHQSLARQRGVTLVDALDPDLPDLSLDQAQIERVISNLLGNAIKFSPDGGTVYVETVAHDEEVVLRVRDQGPGVSPRERPSLFTRYQRLGDRRTRGTGLGLFIVKRIVEAHGGAVAMEFPKRGGSVVSVRLPIPKVLRALRRPAGGLSVVGPLRRQAH